MAETSERLFEEEEPEVEGLDGSGSDMSRIIGMSDAVFAFSLTFLVLSLVLPQVGTTGPKENLWLFLESEKGAFIAYVLSFYIIISWWSAHRTIFSPIIRYDGLLTRINNTFLLVIALTPFLVDVLYFYGPGTSLGPESLSTRLAVALFASVQVIGGLLMIGIWRHACEGHRLVNPKLTPTWMQRTERGELYSTLVFAISIPVAFVSPFGAMLVWIFMAIGLRHAVVSRRRRRRSTRRSVLRRPSTPDTPLAP